MYLYRVVINVPFGATVAFEGWWDKGQELLKTCPGNIGAGGGIGLWNSLARPSEFLNLVGWEDHAAFAAAVRGPVGAWLRDNPLPAGVVLARPGEAWETVSTSPATADPELEAHRYLRQAEYNLRANQAGRFEREVAEIFQVLQEELPTTRARVLYRSAGIPDRYRIVLRSMEIPLLPPRVAAWLAQHPYTDYTDERWVNELYVRAR